jgi:phosphoglucosamine mutase
MLFGSSGIRRTYDLDLVELAVRVGSAIAQDAQQVVVGRDARTTGPLLANAVISGVLSSGASVRYCHIAATPSIAFKTREADAGCMITASHNPEPYNGLKILNPDGSSLTQEQQAHVEGLVSTYLGRGWQEQGNVYADDAVTPHKAAILDSVSIARDITVVADCGNGAGSTITPSLLSDAGVQACCLNCNTSGRFVRPSEPLEEYMPYMSGMVQTLGAACAVVHDGDADRMMAFDDRGRYIGGDQLLMLFADYLESKRVVTTADASMAIETIAEVKRTPVGDTYVSELLREWGDFGGEPSGAWIFPEISYCPDGPYAAALLCEIASEYSLAEEIDRMPRYPVLRESQVCTSPSEILRALGATKATDGIRIEEEDGWCLVRASGTEPKVRLTAEGRTQEKAKEMLEKGRNLLKTAKHS